MKSAIKRFFHALSGARSAQAETDATSIKVGHGAYAVTIPSEFQKVGQLSINISLNTEVSGRYPHSSMRSQVYTDGEAILFIQRMSAPAANTYFKPLDGEKVTKWGKDWRKNTYSMNVADTTPEFDKYNYFIKENGLLERSAYVVEMYDYLASPTSVVRVLAFIPQETAELPAVPESTARYYVESNK